MATSPCLSTRPNPLRILATAVKSEKKDCTWLELKRHGHVLSLAVCSDVFTLGGKVGQQLESQAGPPHGKINSRLVC